MMQASKRALVLLDSAPEVLQAKLTNAQNDLDRAKRVFEAARMEVEKANVAVAKKAKKTKTVCRNRKDFHWLQKRCMLRR
jgi:hypothetical protein